MTKQMRRYLSWKEEQAIGQPHYQHDCKKCVFLGHVVIKGCGADIWVCVREDNLRFSDLIWRHGDIESNYGCTLAGLVSPLSPFASVALALFVGHLGATGANGLYRGTFFKDCEPILEL